MTDQTSLEFDEAAQTGSAASPVDEPEMKGASEAGDETDRDSSPDETPGDPQSGSPAAGAGADDPAVPGDESGTVRREPSGPGRAAQQAAAAVGRLEALIGTYMADFGRWAELERRGRRRWSAIALGVAVPAFFLLGVLVEKEFLIIPLDDPTSGWRGHVWENYGRKIVDCANEALRSGAEVECPLSVRKPW